jgi:hypothetical protein
VIGSVNGHANLLAQAMSDFQTLSPNFYPVVCAVDIAPAIAYGTIIYAHHAAEGIFKELNEEYTVIGGTECTQTVYQSSKIISGSVLAMGAAAAGQMFIENAYNDGWWGALWTATQYIGSTGGYSDKFSFNDSRNPLKGVLGLVSAMVVGAYLGSLYGYGTLVELNVIISISVLRVGPGKIWALVYVIPQLYTILVLTCFLWSRSRS